MMEVRTSGETQTDGEKLQLYRPVFDNLAQVARIYIVLIPKCGPQELPLYSRAQTDRSSPIIFGLILDVLRHSF